MKTRDTAAAYGDCCDHCAMRMPPEDCGRPEFRARWVDADGHASDEIFEICHECLEAGDPDGPGYRVVEEL